MAFNLEKCRQLTEEYDKLSPDAQSILELLSVVYSPVSYNNLLIIANKCGSVRGSGTAFSRNDVRDLGNLLIQKELAAYVSGRGIICQRTIIEVVARKVALRGEFYPFAESVLEVLRDPDYRWRYDYAPYEVMLRRMRMAFYRHDIALYGDLYRLCWRYYPGNMSDMAPEILLAAQPFDGDFMASLPQELAAEVLEELNATQFESFVPIPGLFEYLEQVCSKDTTARNAAIYPVYLRILALQKIFRGEISDAQALALRSTDRFNCMLILGICGLILGDGYIAVEYFEDALNEYKKITRRRKPCFESMESLFFVLALVKVNTPESLRRASDYLKLLEKGRDPYYDDVVVQFRGLVNAQQGVLNKKRSFLFQSKAEGLSFLLGAIADYLVDSELLSGYKDMLGRYSNKAAACGFDWIAGEMAELIWRYRNKQNKDAKYRDRAAAMREKSGAVSLLDLVVREEPWELTLKALAMIQKDKKGATTGEDSRLVWRLKMSRNDWSMHPYIQKRSAKGNWSKGRAITLKRLQEERVSLPFLTPQDIEICSHIKFEKGYGSYYSYSKDFYFFDVGAFPGLIGHPLVFWDDATAAQVDIARGDVALQVSKKKGAISVALDPPFSDEDAVVVVKESYARVVVYEITEQQRHLAKIIRGGLQVPADAENRVAEVLGNVASCITVQSDISNIAVQLPEVSADAQPEVLLLPYEEGLRAQLMVRPLAKGSYYLPGEGGEVVLAEMEGERVQARRNFKEERNRASAVVEGCPTLSRVKPEGDEWLIPEPDGALELLLELQALGEQVRVSWPKGERMRVTRNVSAEDFHMRITSGMDWFSMKGELHLDESLVFDMRQLLEFIALSSSRFVPLGDGQFLALTRTFRKRLDDLRLCAEERGDSLRFHSLATAALEEFAEEAGKAKTDKKWKEHLNHLRDVQAYVPVLPDTLRVELRDYQKEGFQWLARLAHWGVGACLADDMGLGKTVEALALLVSRATEGPSLVVAPTSVCANWIDETRRFAPTLKVHLFGDGDRKAMLGTLASFDLVVCSYGLMQQEEELITAVSWNVIVLDEAQAIKNRTTKRSKVAMKLEGKFKLATTGTPIENHLGELWNLFRFINPGLLGSFERFNNRFAVPIERDQDRETRNRLKRLIQPFVLRRVKEQVLEELPSRTEITLRVELSKEEASFYEALRQQAVATLEGDAESPGQKHLRILAQIMKLRRACCNTALVSPDIPMPSAKLEVFGAIVEELLENRHKALVFSQFVDHLSLIREYLDKKKITYQYLDGATPAKQRKQRVNAFQSGEGDLFLISLKAGGLGLNLTAADYVIHMDPWWNPAVEDQASDRSHRIGQERPVTIYRLVAQDTIEEKIVSLHQKKRGLADSLLEGSDMTGKMNAEELLMLLRESSA